MLSGVRVKSWNLVSCYWSRSNVSSIRYSLFSNINNGPKWDFFSPTYEMLNRISSPSYITCSVQINVAFYLFIFFGLTIMSDHMKPFQIPLDNMRNAFGLKPQAFLDSWKVDTVKVHWWYLPSVKIAGYTISRKNLMEKSHIPAPFVLWKRVDHICSFHLSRVSGFEQSSL